MWNSTQKSKNQIEHWIFKIREYNINFLRVIIFLLFSVSHLKAKLVLKLKFFKTIEHVLASK